MQIAKHLKVRSQTIRSAVNTYNRAASSLKPPREMIKYVDVLDMGFVAQFDLLRHSRPGYDIRKEPWAEPATRVLTDKYFELCRAKEEIFRLNSEWKRMRTWLRDEKKLYAAAIRALRSSDELLANIVQQEWSVVSRSHAIIRRWLARIQSLPGFSASIHPGVALQPESIDPTLQEILNATDETGDVDDEADDGCGKPNVDTGDDDADDGGMFTGHINDPDTLDTMINTLERMAV
jgi:hypothetical protein